MQFQLTAEMVLWFFSVAGPVIVGVLVRKGWLKPAPPKDGDPPKPVTPTPAPGPVPVIPSEPGQRPIIDLLNQLLNNLLPLLNSLRSENNALRAEKEQLQMDLESLQAETVEKK